MKGTKNQRAVYEWVNISDDLVYEWVCFFKGQVYDWGRFRKTGSNPYHNYPQVTARPTVFKLLIGHFWPRQEIVNCMPSHFQKLILVYGVLSDYDNIKDTVPF